MPQTRARLNALAERWPRHVALHKELLEDNIDAWDSYMKYLDAVYAARDGADTLDEAWAYINSKAGGEGADRKRGPYLAQMEFVRRYVDAGRPEMAATVPAMDELLTQYYQVRRPWA